MARKTIIEMVDDLNGEQADQTVTFGLDGVTYEIDLTDENAAKFREEFRPWSEKARRVAGRRKRGTASSAGSRETAQIRQWAKDNGHDVSERGRISAKVREAYAAAH